jgi:hypothetical protein
MARTISNCSNATAFSSAVFFSYILSILLHLKHVMDWSLELGVLRNNDQLRGHFQNQKSALLKKADVPVVAPYSVKMSPSASARSGEI